MNIPCTFCDEIARPEIVKGLSPWWPHEDRVICSNQGALVWPDIAPLVLPWVLVVPRIHSLSFLSSSGDSRNAMMDCLHRLWESLGFGSYNNNPSWLLAFEHGGGTCDASGKRVSECIDHCHLHVIPGTNLLVKAFKNDRPTSHFDFSVDSPDYKSSYLFMGAYDGKHVIKGAIDFSVGENRPRGNYFRDLYVETMDLASGPDRRGSNWRRRMNETWMLLCYDALLEVVSSG